MISTACPVLLEESFTLEGLCQETRLCQLFPCSLPISSGDSGAFIIAFIFPSDGGSNIFSLVLVSQRWPEIQSTGSSVTHQICSEYFSYDQGRFCQTKPKPRCSSCWSLFFGLLISCCQLWVLGTGACLAIRQRRLVLGSNEAVQSLFPPDYHGLFLQKKQKSCVDSDKHLSFRKSYLQFQIRKFNFE